MGYLQSKLTRRSLCRHARAAHAYSATPVRGRKACSTLPGGARQGLIVGYVLQSAAPTGPSPWFLQERVIIAVHRAFVSGCEGPSIAVLCSVASRVARVIPNHLISLIY